MSLKLTDLQTFKTGIQNQIHLSFLHQIFGFALGDDVDRTVVNEYYHGIV